MRRREADGVLGRARVLSLAHRPHLVRFRVFVQMVAAHETFPARFTRETFLAGVRAQVTLQLVGTREALAAKQPAADERTFARVPTQVRLQMRRFTVHLSAVRDVADVQAFFLGVGGRRRVDAVGAPAATAATRGHE